MKKLLMITIIVMLFLITGCEQEDTINANVETNNSNSNTAEDNRIINSLKQSTFDTHKTSIGSLFSMFKTKVEWTVENEGNNTFVVIRVYEDNNMDVLLTFAFCVYTDGNSEYFVLDTIITKDGRLSQSACEKYFENMFLVHGLNKMDKIMEKLEKGKNGN